jgi:hyperosmotically inducible periplasmic protein
MYTQSRNSLLASSVALLLASGNAFAADTLSQDVTEARQETQIWTTYALNPYLRANDLKVSVDNGKATLTGKVAEGVNKDLAKQIALGVSGIKQVDNKIVVQGDYVAAKSASDRSFGEVIDDANITAAVKSKLLWSKHADGLKADVDTRSGKVTLLGSADTGAAKELAGRLATNTRGVIAVDNKLMVKGEKPAVAGAVKDAAHDAKNDVADGWITTKVKSTYAYSSNVDGSDITVSTKSGIVTLSGKVGSGAERELAIELAQNVRGVVSVQSKSLTL